ncbi:hypothetical protein FACS1894139_18560 [Planctomycetales bacterium]|nr:hypothetical protein FACS1894107_16110 [Planctomycetales bacterium]GHS99393.1 hypothetical protein FACS1894108_09280 [Planctomycetales bacterium]GHT08648.1 hypothetical protein FACS1894139_18560 [Planctomycetales bacterium]
MKPAILLTLLLAAAPLFAADYAAPVQKILATIAADEPVWDYIDQIAKIAPADGGDDFAEQLGKLAAAAQPTDKIVIGGALLAVGEQKDGTLVLQQVIENQAVELLLRLDAATLLGASGGEYAANRLRFMLNDEAVPPLLQVELAKSLWQLTFDPAAKARLKKIAFGESKKSRAAIDATLALGQIGQYESDKPDDALRAALRDLSAFPGSVGAQAKLLILADEKNQQTVKSSSFATNLLTEIVDKIHTRYAFDENNEEEADRAKADKLAARASRALVQSLDDFSDYLDEEDYQEMLNSMHGDYGGIGAYVGMRSGLFVILTPMFGKPAQKAGLQAMDVITKIDGEDIGRKSLEQTVKLLKGEPDTTVKLTVIRKGFTEPHDFTVRREVITLPMMFKEELPGNIGYIRLTGFQEDPARRISTASELKRALGELKKNGMKGLILDLRNNPGGLLTEAVAVCENFLQRSDLVVYSKGTFQPRRNYISKVIGQPTYTGPLVVLVNGGSASASEIVSGALRDHKRATLVGTKTFGKGSVQMLLPVETTRGASRLKLTIAKYYLPSGECIHGRDKGIKPHVEVEEEKLTDAARELRIKELENRDVTLWLEENFDRHREEFMALLVAGDDRDPEKYPGFDDLYKLLTEKYPDLVGACGGALDKQTVREELRSTLFAFLRENRGIEDYPVDLESSEVLGRGIAVLGEKIGGLPDLPLYNEFTKKWQAAEAKKRADEALKKATEEETINN